MNIPTRKLVCFFSAVVSAIGLADKADAQYDACSTATPVVAYQPVVTPVSPAAVTGWYPGKLLDTWAANRAAYRSAAFEAATTAYRPVATTVPATSFRPIVSGFRTTYMPVSVYRPTVATTAFSPVVTSYSPIVTSYSPIVTSSVYSDPCSTAGVSGLAGDAYSGMETPTPALGSENVTSQPTLGNGVPQSSYYYSPSTANGGTNANGTDVANSVQRKTNEGDSATDAQGQQQDDEQNGEQDGQQGASFEAPPRYDLRDPRLQDQSQIELNDQTARAGQTAAVAAVYNEPVRPRLITGGQTSKTSRTPLPSRAERDAGWRPVSK